MRNITDFVMLCNFKQMEKTRQTAYNYLDKYLIKARTAMYGLYCGKCFFFFVQ
jgi:hypothetical protein